MEQAWYSALLPNMKPIPKLADLLSPDEARLPRKQSWQEIKAALMVAMPARPRKTPLLR